ncbi:MAG TPA: hypothetical protein VHH73_02595 [Verrucomicrobiae bacterium]|nr:hypothetical protein [Verrucomicrobiae bacterium]
MKTMLLFSLLAAGLVLPLQRLNAQLTLTLPIASAQVDEAAKHAKMKELSTLMAELLKEPKDELERLLIAPTNHASDLVLAGFVADKTKQTFKAVWEKQSLPRDWPGLLAIYHIEERAAVKRLNFVYSEIEFKIMDRYGVSNDKKPGPANPGAASPSP